METHLELLKSKQILCNFCENVEFIFDIVKEIWYYRTHYQYCHKVVTLLRKILILQLKFGIIEIPFTTPYQFGNIGSNIVIEVATNGIEI